MPSGLLGLAVVAREAPLETDQVTSPLSALFAEDEVDGIRLDRHGNPLSYAVLKDHPDSFT